MTTGTQVRGVVPTVLQMSMSDIALLAQVRRPVVSTWRRRAAASDLPFPAALPTVNGEERFDADAVVHWLETSGHGNNPDVRDDAAAFALPAGISLDEPAMFNGLTALLCLRVVSGADFAGMSGPTLQQLAGTFDPADWILRREVSQLGSALVPVAGYADHLSNAAYGSAAAFESLLARRFRHGIAGVVDGAVAAPVHALVTALAGSLARGCGAETPTYVDPTPTGSDLFVSVVRADADFAPDVITAEHDSHAARSFRRRLRVHDVLVTPLADGPASAGPCVLVAHFPSRGDDDTNGDQVIDVIDEIALTMNDGQRAVVVAPASLLTDPLADHDLQQARSQVLRIGRVRAMIRLPKGLVPSRSREALAVWVLGPGLSDRPSDERRVAVADVSDEVLTDLLIDQIRDDVVAAMADPSLVKAHSYARVRLVQTSTIQAQRGGLIPARALTVQAGADASEAVLQVERLRVDRRSQPDALGGVSVTPGQLRAAPILLLGHALQQGALRVVAGNRQGFDLRDDGNVRVIGVPELCGENGVAETRRVDRLTFLGTHDAARLTEAGDVVFCTSPRPRATVDEAGGSAVQYPARVLRVDPARGEGLSPHVIAHTINALPAGSRAWRSWSIPRVPADQVVPLTATCAALSRERAALHARLAELDDLERTLNRSVATGSVALSTNPDSRSPHTTKDD